MSHIPRLFVEQPLASGESIGLPVEQSKYLLRVMRLSQGEPVRVFNGSDGEWVCELRVDGKAAILVPKTQTRVQTSAPDLTLLFAPIKKARTDFIIEKATELGARAIQPVFTDYTQSNRVRVDRMQSLVIEAAEQTERMDLPTVFDGQKLINILAAWNPQMPLIFCDESVDAMPMIKLSDKLRGKGAGLLVGPEGGFSPKEREMLRHHSFVIPITLGPRILRAETAVVSALTLWQSLVGDWQNAPYLPES
ncbi:MAG: 16S rRNA (uracil(1498)-N(3))-methyltransferase [Henriciella sp.]